MKARLASMSELTQHSHGKGVQSELAPITRELRQMIPDTYAGFAALHGAAMAEDALPTKTKELIALAIAVVEQCDGCIASHARGAAKAGATKEEAAEAIWGYLPHGRRPCNDLWPTGLLCIL